MRKVLFGFILLVAIKVLAEDTEFRSTYEGYLYADQQKSVSAIYYLDQRAELKWLFNDAKIILRPRIVSYSAPRKTDSDFNITDLFYERPLNDHAFTTVGLQVYQWGPAELLNPTNPFFHFNNQQRTLLYKEKGRALVRLNVNSDAENNFVLAIEPVSNNERHWIAEKKFKPQAALKYERQWANTRHFAGAVTGVSNDADYFIGEYGQYEFAEGATVYADIKQSMNKFFYEPYQQSPFQRFREAERNNRFSTLGIAGLRYENDIDARVEYIYNSAGYDRDQFKQALMASRELSPYLPENLNRLFASGLELTTKNYIYVSLRKTEPFDIKDLSVFLRSLNSILDHSAVDQVEFDKSVTDWANIFGQASFFRGDTDTEFKLVNDWKASVGVRLVL